MKSSLPAIRKNVPAFRQTLADHWASSRHRRVIIAIAGYIVLAGLIILLVNISSGPVDQDGLSLKLSLTPPPVTETQSSTTQPPGSATQQPTDVTTPQPEETSGPYIAPFDHTDTRPRIALIIKNLGLQESSTQKAVLELPPAITLAFSPYSNNLPFWIDQSREKRHESLIEIPMEAQNFSEIDPGPLALFNLRPWVDNIAVLNQITPAESSHLGFINAFGNRFLNDENRTRSFLSWVNDRDRVFIEDLEMQSNTLSASLADQMGLTYMATGMDVTATPTENEMTYAFRKLEDEARENGFAVATASAYPVTLEIIKNWSAGLAERGIALAPLSAVLERKNEIGIQDSTL